MIMAYSINEFVICKTRLLQKLNINMDIAGR